MARWATSLPLAVLGVLAVWPVPCVDPQTTLALPTPDVKDSLRLVNILIRRPIGPKSIRQDCRMLNSTEFERITGVINRAKRDTVSGIIRRQCLCFKCFVIGRVRCGKRDFESSENSSSSSIP